MTSSGTSAAGSSRELDEFSDAFAVALLEEGLSAAKMAAYKYPRQVEFLDELPKTVSGKLLRRELRARG